MRHIFIVLAALTPKPESDDVMLPLILTMLKIIRYSRKQGCFVVLPIIFLWDASAWNSMQHRGNITPVFLFQSSFVVKGQLYASPVMFLPL